MQPILFIQDFSGSSVTEQIGALIIGVIILGGLAYTVWKVVHVIGDMFSKIFNGNSGS